MGRRTPFVAAAIVVLIVIAAAWAGGRWLWQAVVRLHGGHE